MNGNDDFYTWLTEELGYDPQEAFDIAVGPEEEQGARERPQPASTEAEPAPDPLKQVSSAILANEAMIREEELLENMWKATGGLPMRPSVVSDLNSLAKHGAIQPTSKGFMYMGTPLTPPAQRTPQQAYDSMKSQGLIQPEAMPLRPTDVGWTPYEEQFAAQQRYNDVIKRGGTMQAAIAAAGPNVLAGVGTGRQNLSALLGGGAGGIPTTTGVGNQEFFWTGTSWQRIPKERTYDPSTQVRPYLQRKLASAQTVLDMAIASKDTENIATAKAAVDSINRQLAAFGGGMGISAPTASPTAREVVRVTKDGRRAVFNADTKQFIRYAP